MACGECGTRYDSDQNAFCPRCGSTAKGQVLPAAVAVARRHDPARRRVQASGALLLIVGGLFLVSALASLALSGGDLPPEFAALVQDQPGGTVRLVAPNGTAYSAVVSTLDGAELQRFGNQSGPLEIPLGDRSTVVLAIAREDGTVNVTAVAMAGDTLQVNVLDARDGDLLASRQLHTINRVATALAIVFTGLLLTGGLAAVLLRWFPLAATGASLGVLLAFLALAFFTWAGLLFAIPFGFAAAFVFRGRRFFRRRGPP